MKILLSGYSGAMGRVITEVCQGKSNYNIVAGYARSKTEGFEHPVYDNIFHVKEEVDLIIDFSNVGALTSLLNYGVEKEIPIVLASTGLGQDQYDQIEKASQSTAILQSANMSLGINSLIDIVGSLASSLTDFNVEIVEKHHKYKLDAPSGTANMLVDAVKSGRYDIEEIVHGRQGNDSKRKDGEIGVHAIRGGSIVGEHSVILAGIDEEIEIKHTALSKRIFANGALKAADFLVHKSQGLYTMKDVI